MPGSDLPFMQLQLLDKFNVAYGLLAPLVGGAAASATSISAPPWRPRSMNGSSRTSAIPIHA